MKKFSIANLKSFEELIYNKAIENTNIFFKPIYLSLRVNQTVITMKRCIALLSDPQN